MANLPAEPSVKAQSLALGHHSIPVKHKMTRSCQVRFTINGTFRDSYCLSKLQEVRPGMIRGLNGDLNAETGENAKRMQTQPTIESVDLQDSV